MCVSVSGNYKEKKERQQKREATSGHNWNTLFLGANTVAELMADRYDTSKKEVLTPHSHVLRFCCFWCYCVYVLNYECRLCVESILGVEHRETVNVCNVFGYYSVQLDRMHVYILCLGVEH